MRSSNAMFIDNDAGLGHHLQLAAVSPGVQPTPPSPHRNHHFHSTEITPPYHDTSMSTTTTATSTMMVVEAMMGDGGEANCVEIKEYLWQHSSDLTSLPTTMSVFAAIYTLIISLGVIGNSLVILSVMRHRSLQSVRNMFIVSLSCSDIVVSIVSGTITPITAFTKIWMFGAALCKLVPVIQGASLCFSTLTLTAISIDRFILIIYPMRRPIQKRHALQMIALNCAIATAISTPMLFKQQLVDYMGFCGQFCTEDWGDDQSGRSTYGTIVFILQFVVPFLVITFCYLMISLRLNKGMIVKGCDMGLSSSAAAAAASAIAQRDSLRQNSTNENNNYHISKLANQSEQRRAALKRRLRTNRMLMAMVGVFLCCWTPSVVFNFLRDYQWLPAVVAAQGYLVGIVTHCISMSSTVWNPVLYALLNEQFRFAFTQLLQQLRRRRGAGGGGEHSPTGGGRPGSRAMAPLGSRLISNATYVEMMLNGGGDGAGGGGEVGGGSDKQPTTLSACIANGLAAPTTSRRFTEGSAGSTAGGYRKGSERTRSADVALTGLLRMASSPLQSSPSTHTTEATGLREQEGRGPLLQQPTGHNCQAESAVDRLFQPDDPPVTALTPLINDCHANNNTDDGDDWHAEVSEEFQESEDDQV